MQTDTTIELVLEENMDWSPQCEHRHHGTGSSWHEDGDEHYMRVIAPCGHGDPNHLFVVCKKWLAKAQVHGVECPHCGDKQPFHVANEIVGPVKDYK